MIQKSPARSRTRGAKRAPTTTEIARQRQEIRSEWSSDERRKRVPARRRDAADLRLEAHLRFIEFLIAHNAK